MAFKSISQIYTITEQDKLRFESKFNKTDYCWNWIASKSTIGYGQFGFAKTMMSAHRFSFMLYRGEIPSDMHILHSCDNKVCVNPEHLRVGTHSENMREAAIRHRHIRKPGMYAGVNNPKAKLTEEMVRAIKVDKRSISTLCEIYGVKSTAISDIRAGRSWKHI